MDLHIFQKLHLISSSCDLPGSFSLLQTSASRWLGKRLWHCGTGHPHLTSSLPSTRLSRNILLFTTFWSKGESPQSLHKNHLVPQIVQAAHPLILSLMDLYFWYVLMVFWLVVLTVLMCTVLVGRWIFQCKPQEETGPAWYPISPWHSPFSTTGSKPWNRDWFCWRM